MSEAKAIDRAVGATMDITIPDSYGAAPKVIDRVVGATVDIRLPDSFGAAPKDIETPEEKYENAYEYFYGLAGKNADLNNSMIYFKAAAADEHPLALYQLGWMHYHGAQCTNGHGSVEVDKEKAYDYFLKAFEHGCSYAALYVGWMLLKGEGVPANVNDAVKHMFRGAKSGIDAQGCFRFLETHLYKVPKAQFYIGECYEKSYGVIKDAEKAKIWKRLAGANGVDKL